MRFQSLDALVTERRAVWPAIKSTSRLGPIHTLPAPTDISTEGWCAATFKAAKPSPD